MDNGANSASGVAVDQTCVQEFMSLKTKRTYKFLIFKVNDDGKEIVVDARGDRKGKWEQLTEQLPEHECRYAVWDHDFTNKEGRPMSKIFFILWVPDTAKVRSKMQYASSKDNFRTMLDGINYELQANAPDEIDYEVIIDRCKEA
ncbi:actin-depolymerizing factor [Pycnococcus provasolii]